MRAGEESPAPRMLLTDLTGHVVGRLAPTRSKNGRELRLCYLNAAGRWEERTEFHELEIEHALFAVVIFGAYLRIPGGCQTWIGDETLRERVLVENVLY